MEAISEVSDVVTLAAVLMLYVDSTAARGKNGSTWRSNTSGSKIEHEGKRRSCFEVVACALRVVC